MSLGNRQRKAWRLVDEDRVRAIPGDQLVTFAVRGDSDEVRLVTVLPKPASAWGRKVPPWSCTCPAGIRDSSPCSHILAAYVLRHRTEATESKGSDPFEGL